MILFGNRELWCISVVVVVALLIPVMVWGLPRSFPEPPGEASPQLQAIRISADMSIDGQLNEAAWQQAHQATEFTQIEPTEGQPATFRTEVRVLYGEDGLYIGAVMHDDAPDKIMQNLSRRDEIGQADQFQVSIDSRFDQQTARAFIVSAAGVQADGKVSSGFDRLDTSWDAVWYSEVRVTDQGWVAELEIPYSMLRFNRKTDVWGINFQREIPRLSETDQWAYVPSTERRSSYVANFGRLTGVRGITPARNVQVIPYGMTEVTRRQAPGGSIENTAMADVGGDVKVGLTPGTMLDATINPDFGQVESDPAVLNLSTVETFFPEKRQFFLEGTDIFDLSYERQGGLLYTRRIGTPASPIIGATKLTGRSEAGYSYGVLAATTGQNWDPGRYYGVARLRKDIGGPSYFGGMITGYRADDRAERFGIGRRGNERAVAGGIDWDLRFLDQAYQATGSLVTTAVGNGTFGRPGFGGELSLSQVRGALQFGSDVNFFDAHFDPNDVGRVRRNNVVDVGLNVRYYINNNRPFGPFRQAFVGWFGGNEWSFRSRRNLGFGFFLFSNWQLETFQRVRLVVRTRDVGGYSIRETRGLGPYKTPSRYSTEVEFHTDSRKRFRLTPLVEYTYSSYGGMEWEPALEARWNNGQGLSLSSTVEVELTRDMVDWASNESFLQEDGTWYIGPSRQHPEGLSMDEFSVIDEGHHLREILGDESGLSGADRYYLPVFGERDTREVSLTLRGELAFSRTVSLQLFNQLFAARGQYENFGLLTAPDEIERFPGYPKRHDFLRHSYISNLVFRWQYLPGSTFFLIWNQNRNLRQSGYLADEDGNTLYDQSAPVQLVNTFDAFPTNVLLAKLEFRFVNR